MPDPCHSPKLINYNPREKLLKFSGVNSNLPLPMRFSVRRKRQRHIDSGGKPRGPKSSGTKAKGQNRGYDPGSNLSFINSSRGEWLRIEWVWECRELSEFCKRGYVQKTMAPLQYAESTRFQKQVTSKFGRICQTQFEQVSCVLGGPLQLWCWSYLPWDIAASFSKLHPRKQWQFGSLWSSSYLIGRSHRCGPGFVGRLHIHTSARALCIA